MSFLASFTKAQRTSLLILLFLNLFCLYCGFIPLVIYRGIQPHEPPVAAVSTDEKIAVLQGTPTLADVPLAIHATQTVPTPLPNGVAVILAPSRTPTRKPIPLAKTPTRTATRTRTVTPSPTIPPTNTPTPTKENTPIRFMESQTLANLQLNPRAGLTKQTTFFTSACYGAGANPLQDRDNMAPADWSGSPDRKCIFGFRVDPRTGMPTGRYSVFGGRDGEPHFSIIPPDAFASDLTQVKQLSQIQLIVDPAQGCNELGTIGITADGARYQCPACMLLKAGGMCLSEDGTKSLVLPTNNAFILDADRTGGATGFQSYPVLFFRRGFSVYFTGKSGYAPSRLYFESTVDTLRPEVNYKTTAEMSYAEIREIAASFDAWSSRSSSLISMASLERPAQAISANPVRVSSAETGAISFRAPPETVLSSIVWTIKPINNIDKKAFLEMNLCMDLNGERTCFTGVEDFAHCAFFNSCVTGFSSLVGTGDGGYIATRYFTPGTAPAIHDPVVRFQFQAPDTGTVLEMNVLLRVRSIDPTLLPHR